ncbi:hypothetical protein CC79DRAFT_1331044 [Sarocladium strictum]
MHPYLVFIFLGLVAAQDVNYPDPSIPCGSTSDSGSSSGDNLCPSPDLYCKPDDTECADLTRCSGRCAFKNMFVRCGGFRLPGPAPCEYDETCADDPRNPESCGMACDAPGVCISQRMVECVDDTGCPDGQWCYEDVKGQTGFSKVCM